EEHRPHRLRVVGVLRVRRHADDLVVCRVPRRGPAKMAADRILAGEVALRERLTHDRDALRIDRVVLGNRASADDRRADRLEVPGADAIEERWKRPRSALEVNTAAP